MSQNHRKLPFSGKAKKEQLKSKRNRKMQQTEVSLSFIDKNVGRNTEDLSSGPSVQKVNYQPTRGKDSRPNRYALQFYRETNEELRQKREEARMQLEPVREVDLEIDAKDFFDERLDFPKRPPWNHNLSKQELDARENRYFLQYQQEIEQNFDLKDLSYFELNLETWRQFWRVLEMSDIILFIVDARFPAAMFPPSLYDYVTRELGKDFLLVLNKTDLVPAPLVAAWKHYFETNYPKLKLCLFTSNPGYNLIGQRLDKGGLQIRRRKGRVRMATEGAQQILDACKSLVGDQVDLSKWQAKIDEERRDSEEKGPVEVGKKLKSTNNVEYHQYERFQGGILTIGCLGQPNVGKSSLMNAMMGKKVVSVSRTPGHTKHFQTIFLTNNVRLCDCPGLVFPSKVPKPLQVLMGSFPIAQLRDPYTTIRFLAERLDLVKMLRIEHPCNDDTWSAIDICDGWAKKRGYLTAKTARLDSYRAANSLLRMALDGKICLCLRPPNYTENKEFWRTHPDVKAVKWIQALSGDNDEDVEDDVASINTDSDEEKEEDRKQNPSSESDEDSSSSSHEAIASTNKFAALSSLM